MRRDISSKLLGYLLQHDLKELFFDDRSFHATFYCEKLLAFLVRRNGNFVEVLEETESGELQSAVFILQPCKGRLRVVSDWNEVALASEEFGDQSL
ncbi:MAG: hypothetical protein ACKOX6_02040 [Bdellovibrio sp.]